ncbi:TrbC/VirB2 family protein [Marinospirillum insulare]|uniref:Type IV secretion system protein VirB2 n=1 Tax=Marinospirillum insulare TaxID=217169 RepID=A0ABQ6A1C8_9GAMM|nr:TrbC/VirB2 family protein [Marinospirillum insulare]GLR65097.1 hypothetical protein GCM10007878_25360 [Marinospirillum insulare]
MYEIKTKLNKAFYFMCALAITTFPSFAFANDLDTEFEPFMNSIKVLITGSLGKAVALIALLLGGLIGLAKSSAWPALTGLAIAAVFGLGPFLIETIFDTFSAIGP